MRETVLVSGPSTAPHFLMGSRKPFYTPAIPKRPVHHSREAHLGRRPSLGAGGVNFDTLTIVSALGGAVGVLSAKALPEPGNVIVKVVGYAAIAFAVYHAFLENASASAAPDKNATGSPVPGAAIAIAPTTAFAKVSGSFLSPTPGEKIGPGFLRTTYPVRIVLSNGSAEQVSFYYQIMSAEDPVYVWPVDQSYNARVTGQVAQSYITLKPKEQRTIDLRVDVVATGTVATNHINVELSLQKRQSAESAWQNLSAVAFEYARSY